MNWHRNNTSIFINLVRERPVIWDVFCPDRKNKTMRNEAFDEIADEMGISAKDANAKWSSLRSQYHREKKRFNESNSEGAPKWFAYAEMKSLMYFEEDDPFSDSGSSKMELSTFTISPSRLSQATPPAPVSSASSPSVTLTTLLERPFTQNHGASDDLSTFGLYVSAQLRKFGPRLQSKAKLEINKLMYEIEMEHLESI